MELKELIERAEKVAGSQKALGLMVRQAPSTLRAAKAGIQGLPVYACVMIAELINVPEITVIAASELITEKKEERRAIFVPFVMRGIAALIAVSIFNVPLTPANAAPVFNNNHQECILCKIANRFRKSLKEALQTLQMCIPKPFSRS